MIMNDSVGESYHKLGKLAMSITIITAIGQTDITVWVRCSFNSNTNGTSLGLEAILVSLDTKLNLK